MSSYGGGSYGGSYGGGSYGGSSSYTPSAAAQNAAKEQLQQEVMMEQRRALLQAAIGKLTEVCWSKCMASSTPGSSLSSSQNTCIENCVGRYVDMSQFMQKKMTTPRH